MSLTFWSCSWPLLLSLKSNTMLPAAMPRFNMDVLMWRPNGYKTDAASRGASPNGQKQCTTIKALYRASINRDKPTLPIC
jgi:hypothetical protein